VAFGVRAGIRQAGSCCGTENLVRSAAGAGTTNLIFGQGPATDTLNKRITSTLFIVGKYFAVLFDFFLIIFLTKFV